MSTQPCFRPPVRVPRESAGLSITRFARSAVGITALLILAPGDAFAQYAYTNIVDTTVVSPHGTLFTQFNVPSLNNAGKVAFIANAGTQRPRSVYVGDSTPNISIVASNDGPAPGGGTHSNLIGAAFVNNSDIVGYQSNVGGDNSGAGILTGAAGPTPLGVVAHWGQVAPDTGGGTINFGSVSVSITLNDSNTGAFFAPIANGITSGGIFKGVQGASVGTLTKIAVVGDTAPGTGGGTFFMSISTSASPGINNTGQVAFHANVTGGTASRGVFVGDGVNPISPIALVGGAAVGGGTYTGFLLPGVRINDAGRVVFAAGTNQGNRLIAVGGGLPDIVLAMSGSAAPGGGVFSAYDGPNINSSGLVAFFATVTGAPGSGTGIFTSGPGSGSSQKVIRMGDSLFGSIVTGVRTNSSGSATGLNDLGQVAFEYVLADGRQGIAVATPNLAVAAAPEPGTFALLLPVGFAVTLLRRRR